MKAIITGATKGIGRAIAIKLAENGYDLILVARNPKELDNFRVELLVFTKQVLVYAVDCADKAQVQNFLKNAEKEQIVDAIQLVIKGKTYLSHEAAQSLKGNVNNQIILTRREKEILELIAEGLTNNEIAQQLFISISTVDTHRKNLLTKFDTKNTASLVKKAIQLQLISV